MTLGQLYAEARALIVTRDFLEAEDVGDVLRLANLGPAVHVVDEVDGLEILRARRGSEPRVMVVSHSESRIFDVLVREADGRRIGVIVLDGRAKHGDCRVVHVARPFSSHDIKVALDQVLA